VARRPDDSLCGSELQTLLAALIDLALNVKHAHWNCYGAGFRELHLHLGELADRIGAKVDAVAEHAVAKGVSPDGRSASIVAESPLRRLPSGPLQIEAAISEIGAVLDGAIEVCHATLRALGDTDAVGTDLVVSTVGLLEHHRWMLAAEFSSEPPAMPPRSGD
jgi:starvation-inducible DNA-binding protein